MQNVVRCRQLYRYGYLLSGRNRRLHRVRCIQQCYRCIDIVQGVLGTDAPTVDTTSLDAKSVGTPRKCTSTYVGQDSLMQLLKSHPDVEYQVKLPDGMGDFLMSLLPTLLLIGLMVFFFAQMNKANNSQMSFGKAKAKEYTQESTPMYVSTTSLAKTRRSRASGNQRLPRQP